MAELARYTDVYKNGKLIETFKGDDSYKQAVDEYGEPVYPDLTFSTYFTSATAFSVKSSIHDD